MPFKLPLTFDELHLIGERNRGNKDVVALLWEIKRLQSMVLRLDQLARSVPHEAGGTGLIAKAAAAECAREPVVIKQRAEHAELFRPDVQPGDDD